MRRKLIAGNWKMNGLTSDGRDLAEDLARRMQAAGDRPPAGELLVCPPFTLLQAVRDAVSGSAIALGAQDCHPQASGAFTGDISAPMLADLGCRYVILGHSERRQFHDEGDARVLAKAEAALASGLTPIICVGETEVERESGAALAVIARQLRGSLPAEAPGSVVVAYEPVWAIGTGKTAQPSDVVEVHSEIRRLLQERLGAAAGAEVRILYGGSVKPGNAAELLASTDVDGALVGGASLKAEDFWAIAQSCP
jgi:triosephosphate isomerase